jgi:protein PhnA
MSIDRELRARSGGGGDDGDERCELCASVDDLAGFWVAPRPDDAAENFALLCVTCRARIEQPDSLDANHWRCLNDSMWSQTPAVQVLVWRLLTRLRAAGWPGDLLDMLYLDDDTQAWAQAGESATGEEDISHLDSNGALLTAGDTVILIKDLAVKGANFTAKRGTAVRGISLVVDNPEQIEGRVNGQQIVILTRFVKKST